MSETLLNIVAVGGFAPTPKVSYGRENMICQKTGEVFAYCAD